MTLQRSATSQLFTSVQCCAGGIQPVNSILAERLQQDATLQRCVAAVMHGDVTTSNERAASGEHSPGVRSQRMEGAGSVTQPSLDPVQELRQAARDLVRSLPPASCSAH